MAIANTRAVLVVRETDYELLLARHATRGQARFFLESRGQRLAEVEARHHDFHAVLARARASIPAEWRQAVVKRGDLDRFLFEPDDVVVAVGQDGLVANVAKYLDTQPVIGINPAPDLYDGVLARLRVERLEALLPASAAGAVPVERRTLPAPLSSRSASCRDERSGDKKMDRERKCDAAEGLIDDAREQVRDG
ncbi:hypothetical protein AEGHOMDF_2440 [Methylobacterium soli]|nr:hypothetical protein AEGHOMDF_2440 [Methylobacterium soli]